MTTLRVTIFGAGRIGRELARVLAPAGGFDVRVVDVSEDAIRDLQQLNLPIRVQALTGRHEWATSLRDTDVVVAAVPENAVREIAGLAAEMNVHYLDFSPRSATREALVSLATSRVILNGCGVAPGLVENVAMSLACSFDRLEDLVVRVGSLPQFPTNRLGYGQVWDIDGLVAEYTRPCDVLLEGEIAQVAPLEDLEQVRIAGVPYEAFTTSGGLRDLTPFLRRGLRNVVFKTLRYPGHLEYIRFLLDDLDLRRRLYQFRSLLMNGLPVVEFDELILFLTAKGHCNHLPTERSVLYRFRAGSDQDSRNTLTSIAAGHAASLLSMLRDGEFDPNGFVGHEALPAERLLQSEFLSRFRVNPAFP